jgi:hypothetical protein
MTTEEKLMITKTIGTKSQVITMPPKSSLDINNYESCQEKEQKKFELPYKGFYTKR